MKKLFTTLLVLSIFAFAGTPSAQAQSKKAGYNQHKLEGLAMAAFRQTCDINGKVDVEFRVLRRGIFSRFVFRNNEGIRVGYSRIIRTSSLNEIKSPSDINIICSTR